MQEKRLSARLLSYWDRVRKDDDVPDFRKFNTGAVEDIWSHCFHVSVASQAKKPVYKYEYMGPAIAEAYGRNLTGVIVDQATRQFPGKVIHKRFNEIVRSATPLHDEGHFINDNGSIVKYRACILPFGTPKRGITDIVVGLSCRSFK